MEMEFSQAGLLELDELMALKRDTWNSIPLGVNEFLPGTWNFDCLEDNPIFSAPADFDCSFSEAFPFVDGFSVPAELDSPPLPLREDCPAMLGEEGKSGSCKIDTEQRTRSPVFAVGLCGEKKSKSKRVDGQPSKNLMAERRRRKRLNDRLSMLRSIVPKISKMDRTSILGDTIDYMKELLERINRMQEEETEENGDRANSLGALKEPDAKEVLVRNSPKFDVERRNEDTRIEISCATKPGLLASTVNTLEALGLEIQECVISCFNDFTMQASCSEPDQTIDRRITSSAEDIKQALFINAGYGGRCL